MNIKTIKKEVQAIAGIAKLDDETAHSREDQLRDNFIQYVASNSTGELAEMAHEVLKTNDINFARWTG